VLNIINVKNYKEEFMLRMKRMFINLLVMCAMGVASAFGQVTSGQPAPDFTLTDTNGQQHSLSDYKGKFVVLEWFNPDCPFVKKHYDNSGNIPQLQKQYTAKGVAWLSINSSAEGKEGHYSSQELNKYMAGQGGTASAVFVDADGRVGHLYGAQTTPHIFVIDPQGILIYQGAIDDISSADSEDIKTAHNYVRTTLDAAMNGQPVPVSTTKSYGCSVKYIKIRKMTWRK
jgi:hypothetical protein